MPFYRKQFDDAGFDPEELRSIADLRRLPFTEKGDLRKAYPYGLFAVPLREVVRLHASGGTGSASIVLGYTRNDIKTWSNLVARTLVAAAGSPRTTWSRSPSTTASSPAPSASTTAPSGSARR